MEGESRNTEGEKNGRGERIVVGKGVSESGV